MIKNLLLIISICLLTVRCSMKNESEIIMTVNGAISPHEMDTSLIHEHILVDFIGANEISPQRWDHREVMDVAIPHLQKAKGSGVKTLIECTPAYLGRDAVLLKKIAGELNLHIITNTGYYGARDNKFLPSHAFTESADELAERWMEEWENGIGDTEVKPGFIKIGVDDGPLSDIHKKLITAAARTHLKTGLTIASHTGLAVPAFEQLAILEKEGVAANAFIWVHAQAEKDAEQHVKAAQKGAWISLDGASGQNIEEYVKMISNLKDRGLLNRVLISHDAGWYSPGEENGGNYRGYTDIFEHLIPALKDEDFSDEEIKMLLTANPAKAFTVRIRKM